jgi:hypothetical protein
MLVWSLTSPSERVAFPSSKETRFLHHYTDLIIQTSGDTGLRDSDDADSTTLSNQRISVTLRGLEGNGLLDGQYASTWPTRAYQTRAHSQQNTFNYTRADDRFEEVMCYYHVDAVQRYTRSLGFANINNRQIGIHVNGTNEHNAWYDPSPTSKMLTFGTGGVDAAEDADVIWHEMGHCIQDSQVPGWGTSHEARSMGEGFGDYWAASQFAGAGPRAPGWDIYLGEWFASSGSGNPPFTRKLDSPKHYPEDMTNRSMHADGEIWSACLWRIRGIVGRRRADTMILESHFKLSPGASFRDGANAILDVNRTLYGADQAAIRQVFADRGILVDDNAAYVADVTVPDGTAFAANQAFTKVWRVRNTGTSTWGPGYRWAFDGGDRMDGPDYISVPTVRPGGTWDPSVSLRAPGRAGTYRGYWRMQAPDGQKFGTRVWVQINVSAGVTTFVSESSTAPYNGAPGFWRWGTPGYWHEATGVGEGNHMLWTWNNDPAHGIDNMGDWRPNLPETRRYEVYVHIPRNHATTTQARYEIYHADGRRDVTLNQSIYFNAWVSLGTYRFERGTGGFLRLIDRTDEPYASKKIGFDAAMWEPR